ncbi:RIO1 family-domain-containing protein, partial [Pavlovales sp. CCMP2436]
MDAAPAHAVETRTEATGAAELLVENAEAMTGAPTGLVREGGDGGDEEGEEEDEEEDEDEEPLSDEDESAVDAALADAFASWDDEGGSLRLGRAGTSSRVRDAMTGAGSRTLGCAAANSIQKAEKKAEAPRNVGLSREGRATSEGVLDPRTRMILFKLLSAGHFAEIHGCISTGKEANVYYAIDRAGAELAVKVFKTSILVFKDRDKYVAGDFRFRHGYCRSNPRKMVRVWAEKEVRNLQRIHSAGVPSPQPLLLRGHVLLMRFIGIEGRAAPRLKDAGLSVEKSTSAYRQCCVALRRLFHECR